MELTKKYLSYHENPIDSHTCSTIYYLLINTDLAVTILLRILYHLGKFPIASFPDNNTTCSVISVCREKPIDNPGGRRGQTNPDGKFISFIVWQDIFHLSLKRSLLQWRDLCTADLTGRLSGRLAKIKLSRNLLLEIVRGKEGLVKR
ncbi:hypothetical protein CEXT_591021 [Caerostris extrusa]|uniref:Uncharacterized protein n=1 Tax=Caerostris extrusa TaxID=172846 RepID=A0AAV4SKZ3_CAEEX|nr:hypothetical protein CEXT_591021 [Caerostris extrusa]